MSCHSIHAVFLALLSFDTFRYSQDTDSSVILRFAQDNDSSVILRFAQDNDKPVILSEAKDLVMQRFKCRARQNDRFNIILLHP